MKKFIIIFITLFTFGFSTDLIGTIEHIDYNKHLITVNGQVVKVQPFTKIQEDDCGIFDIDNYLSFKELKIGSFVEVDVVFDKFGSMIAEDIDVKCRNNRAY